jgi:hypothetical protein
MAFYNFFFFFFFLEVKKKKKKKKTAYFRELEKESLPLKKVESFQLFHLYTIKDSNSNTIPSKTVLVAQKTYRKEKAGLLEIIECVSSQNLSSLPKSKSISMYFLIPRLWRKCLHKPLPNWSNSMAPFHQRSTASGEMKCLQFSPL